MTSFIARTRTTGAVALTTAGLMALGLGAASAHVTVAPASTSENGYSQLTFSVPNESETAATNKLEVQLPTEQPFTSVRVKPMAGWTAEVITGDLPEPVTTDDGVTLTEAPLSVVWTAEPGSEISQQEYQTFSISVGRLPEEGTTVLLPASQSYDDGSVVDWDEEMGEGEEAENPAPMFVTTAAEADGHGGHSHGGAAAEETGSAEASDTEQTSATSDASSSSAVGWVGLVAGLLGLAAGVVALVRTRRTA